MACRDVVVKWRERSQIYMTVWQPHSQVISGLGMRPQVWKYRMNSSHNCREHTNLFGVQSKFFDHRQRLCSKSFVQLKEINIVNTPTSLSQLRVQTTQTNQLSITSCSPS